MIAVVYVTSTVFDGAYVEAQLQHGAASVFRVEDGGPWLVASRLTATSLRDWLKVRLPGTNFVVAELSGNWAGFGVKNDADWLKAWNGFF